MLAADEAAMAYSPLHLPEVAIAAFFAGLVLAAGWAINKWRAARHAGHASDDGGPSGAV